MGELKKLSDYDLSTIDPSILIEIAEERAKDFKYDGLKTNQIRNFYTAVTKLKVDYTLKRGDVFKKLTLLKPQLAYAAGRQKAVRANFYPFLKMAIEGVQRFDDIERKGKALENFFILVESIVAYHKFYGGS